jgi:putative transposase
MSHFSSLKKIYQLTIQNLIIKHNNIISFNEFINISTLYETKKRLAKTQFNHFRENNNLSKDDIKDILIFLNKSNDLNINSTNINKMASRISQIYTYYALQKYDNWTKCFRNMPEKRMRKKSSTSSFIHQFPLKVNHYSIRKYNIKFKASQELYNSILGEIFNRHYLMLSDLSYQHACVLSKLDNSKSEAKQLFSKLLTKYELSKNDMQKFAKLTKSKSYMKDHLDSDSIQTLSDRAFNAYFEYRLGKRGKPRFKSWKNGIKSMQGKKNACLSFKNNTFSWNGIKSTIILQNNDKYGVQEHALNSKIKYCRIVRKNIKGQYKFYLQLTLEGLPKLKDNTIIVNGQNGIDIGVSTIASVGQNKALIAPFCQELNDIENEIAIIQRKKSRSLRLNNIDNFEDDNYVKIDKHFKLKKGKNIKGKTSWIKSNNYLNLENELKELHRKQANKRQYLHNVLANKVLENGNNIVIEDNNYKAWQKGLYGKTIGKKAPSNFVQTLKRKALKTNGTFDKIDTWSTKFSQYCHVCEGYHKKPLSQRTHYCGENEIAQRDLYSALLMANYNLKEKNVNRDSIISNWKGIETFLKQALLTLSKSRNKGNIPTCLIPKDIEKRDLLVNGLGVL